MRKLWPEHCFLFFKKPFSVHQCVFLTTYTNTDIDIRARNMFPLVFALVARVVSTRILAQGMLASQTRTYMHTRHNHASANDCQRIVIYANCHLMYSFDYVSLRHCDSEPESVPMFRPDFWLCVLVCVCVYHNKPIYL